MAKTVVNLSDSMAQFVVKANQISTHVGDTTQLTTIEDSDLVGAINELVTAGTTYALDSDVGARASLITDDKANLVTAINEIKTQALGIDSNLAVYLRSDVTDTKTAGDLVFSDNVKAAFGDVSDLQIYHDGSHSYVSDAGTGNLQLSTNGTAIKMLRGNGEALGNFNIGGSVDLYHNNVKKFETTVTGVDVTGNIDFSGGILASNGSVQFVMDKDNNGGEVFVWGHNASDATTNELMRLTSAGLLGIGTPGPSQKLTVEGTANNQNSEIRITASGVASGYLGANSDGLNIGTDSYNIVFKTSVTGAGSVGATGTERMRITSAGNVGIGAAETSLFNGAGGVARLVVTGDTANTNITQNTNASIVISNTNTTAGNTSGLHFARADTDNSPNFAGASIVAQFPDTQATGQYPRGELAFLTSTSANTAPSEKMRIDATGNLLLNTQSVLNNGRLSISENLGTAVGITMQNTINRTVGNTFISFINEVGAISGSIQHAGTSTISFNTSSDYRLKTSVNYDWDATSRLKKIKPARFKWIADGDDGVTVDGFLAHELQEAVPEAVSGDKDEVDSDNNPLYQSVDHSKIVPLLVKTIQELEARIVELEAK